MKLLEKIRLLREFNQLRRQARRDNPTWDAEDCALYAMDQMEVKYGSSPDWSSIIQMLFEFFMKILPFLFLTEGEPDPTE